MSASASSQGHGDADRLWCIAIAVSLGVAFVLRGALHTNWDVSWLLYVAERSIDGALPYRDFLEVNPPASILIYVPAVLLARAAHVTPEAMTDGLVFLAAASSLILSGRILSRARLVGGDRTAALALASCVVLLILPLNSFGQRDHIVLVAMLPILSSIAARIEGGALPTIDILLAGLGAGIALSIKPAFALTLLAPLPWLASASGVRTLLLLPEAWLCATVVAIYVLLVDVFCPDYAVRTLPLMLTIYLPVRLSIPDLIAAPIACLWILAVIVFVASMSIRDRLGRVLILASAGGAAAYMVQGKGFIYHAYPAVALALLACVAALTTREIGSAGSRHAHWARVAVFSAVLLASIAVFAERSDPNQDAPGLSQAIAAISPHPRLLTIGDDMSLGRVLAREMGGETVGSAPVPWIIVYALSMTPKAESDPRFAEAIRMERDAYAADIDRGHPDAILVQGEGWLRWTRRSQALVRALSDYRSAGLYGQVHLFSRHPTPEAASESGGGAVSGALAAAGAVDQTGVP